MAQIAVVPSPAGPVASPVSWRALALPSEHGGWGLLAEPLLLGLAIAPSAGGAAVAVAALSAFLLRHPARLAAADARRRAWYPRTGAALALAGAYGAAALVGGVFALTWAKGPLDVWLVVAAPLAALYLFYDVRGRGREAPAELAAAAALSAGGPAVALAAGWTLLPAFGLWLLLAGRGLGSVLDVRCRLRRQRGIAAPAAPVGLTQALAVVASSTAAWFHALPAAAALVPAVLWLRSMWNLRKGAPPIRPQDVGWSEMRAGALATLVWVLVYRLASWA
jgi:hypothetical protein